MKIDPQYLKETSLLKHYRTIRKWACKSNNLTDSDIELLIYLDCEGRFTKNDYEKGVFSYSWDKRRWDRLFKNGWIVVWRTRNQTTQKYNVYEVSLRTKQMINKMYKIMLGQENLPTSSYNKIMLGKTYSDKVLSKSIISVNNDKKK